MNTLMTMDTQTIRWPAFIVALVLAFAAFTWWSLTRAASSVSAVTDAGYYSRGLTYNRTSRDLSSAAALGWKITPQVDGRRLIIQLEDARQSAVPGCQGVITVRQEGADRRTLPLTDAGLGRYTVDLPADLPSPVSASLTLTGDGAALQSRLLLALEQ